MTAYTKMHFDFDQIAGLVSPRQQLDLAAVGIGIIRLPAGQGYTFTHSHKEQEEVYVVMGGSGVILIDGALIPLQRGDVVRTAPEARRALRAADHEPLLVLCAGAVAAGYPKDPNARFLIDDGIPDYDDIPPWYAGNPEVKRRNEELKARMRRPKP
ncbi:MAG: cupin domain-containing protein [Planctomycetota bacterium]|nr:MAG: cupin domain-containing protein [Planctomycetota bacterium]